MPARLEVAIAVAVIVVAALVLMGLTRWRR
jgi:hypothetical protein